MAIVKMKRLRVIALAAQRDALLSRLLRAGCVEISEPAEDSEDNLRALMHRDASILPEQRAKLTGVTAALDALNRYAPEKKKLLSARPVVGEEEFLSEQALESALEAAQSINAAVARLGQLQARENRLSNQRAALVPWEELDLPLDFSGTAHVRASLFTCPPGELSALRQELADQAGEAELLEAGCDRENAYLLLLCHQEEAEAALALLRPHGCLPCVFKDLTGTPRENIRRIDAELEEIGRQRKAEEEAIAALAPKRPELKLCSDRLETEIGRAEARDRLLTNGTVLLLEGWCSEPGLPKVEKILTELGCAWEAEDPASEEYPSVPIQLKNNWFTRPLNMVTEMYSLPAYGTVDPNPYMAPFFILFYGMMMADMGYGLIMTLLSVIVMKKCRPKGATMKHMIPLLGLCGVSTFIWGAATGSFFGDLLPQMAALIDPNTTFTALPALFSPLDDAVAVLVGALILGVVQIFVGMGVSTAQKVKHGQIWDAVFGEVTWWVILIGAALMILNITPILLILGGVLLVAGSAYQAVQGGGGPVKIVLMTLKNIGGALYNNVTGYFSDILSYSRLMALMLAGAVVAQVFNQLGVMTGNVITFFLIAMIGNALNFALNILGCYVHDMRLQCLEFFGRFYEDGGKPFRPMNITSKYVDVTNQF